MGMASLSTWCKHVGELSKLSQQCPLKYIQLSVSQCMFLSGSVHVFHSAFRAVGHTSPQLESLVAVPILNILFCALHCSALADQGIHCCPCKEKDPTGHRAQFPKLSSANPSLSPLHVAG